MRDNEMIGGDVRLTDSVAARSAIHQVSADREGLPVLPAARVVDAASS